MVDAGVDPASFRHVLGHFPTGVTVVTALHQTGPLGLTIGSFASVSLEPPLVMFGVDKQSTTWAKMAPCEKFCVNVLSEKQRDISAAFSQRATERFDGIAWNTNATDSPVIEGAIAWIDCHLRATHDGGDHIIVVGLVRSLSTANQQEGPLVFCKGSFGRFQPLDSSP